MADGCRSSPAAGREARSRRSDGGTPAWSAGEVETFWNRRRTCAAASDRPARPARPGYTASLLMWPGCLWETHTGGGKDTRRARESRDQYIPAHRRRRRWELHA